MDTDEVTHYLDNSLELLFELGFITEEQYEALEAEQSELASKLRYDAKILNAKAEIIRLQDIVDADNKKTA